MKAIFRANIFFFLISSTQISAGVNLGLENENLSVWFNESGDMFFRDRKNDVQWGSSYTGWVKLSDERGAEKISLSSSDFRQTVSGDSIFFQFSGIMGDRLADEGFVLKGRLSLDKTLLSFEILECQSRFDLLDIEYPAHLLGIRSGLKDAYIVIPHLQGIIIPSRYDAGFMRYGQNIWDLIADQEKWWDFESGNLNMPWFGACTGNSSILVRVISSSDCALHLIGNSVVGTEGYTVNARQGENPGIRMSSLSPVWKSSKGKLSYPRTMCIETVENGYVGMAKRYKEFARSSGRYVSLKEKIRINPECEKIIGAPDIKIYCYTHRLDSPYFRAWSEPVLNGYTRVNTSFDQVAAMADDLSGAGVDKCMILLAGWNRMGYDREHVDMWPPSEAAGGIDGLSKACQAVIEKGYLFALHDNYDDFYPDAPTYDEKYILRDKDGSLHLGGVWDGGLCHITCPAMREVLLSRNLDKILESLPLNSYYFDVITSTSHYECYDERHPITRKQDLGLRLGLLEHVVSKGLVVGGERGTDWAVPVVTFCEGLSGGGTGYHRGIAYQTGLTVPLFYLVYRECVVGYWQHGTPHGREDHANHVLLDALNGQPSSWSLEYGQWRDLKPMIVETYELLGRLHEETAHFAMTDHRIMTPDYMVQRSELEDGTSIWVNFGITSYQAHNFEMPPKSLRIERPGKPILSAIISREISYLDK
jgi:hypothetical protein